MQINNRLIFPSLVLQTVIANPCFSDSTVTSDLSFLDNAGYDIQSQAESSVALFGGKNQVMTKIFELAEECSMEDWDGYGALPLSRKSLDDGLLFVRLLPDGTPLPDVSPEPDGVLALEWDTSKNRRLSLSFCESGRIAYAWLDGTDRGHAVARFDGQSIPRRVQEAIFSITA